MVCTCLLGQQLEPLVFGAKRGYPCNHQSIEQCQLWGRKDSSQFPIYLVVVLGRPNTPFCQFPITLDWWQLNFGLKIQSIPCSFRLWLTFNLHMPTLPSTSWQPFESSGVSEIQISVQQSITKILTNLLYSRFSVPLADLQLTAVPKAWMKIFLFRIFFKEFQISVSSSWIWMKLC
jgi:hypothetical protein